MKPINDLLLAAYLDGEADPAERSRVDAALAADPVLADRMRKIASTRDLIASLSRTSCPRDLAREVLARLAAAPAIDRPAAVVSDHRDRIVSIVSTRGRFIGFAAAIAAAAAAVLIIAVAYRPNRQNAANQLARVDSSSSKSIHERNLASSYIKNKHDRLSRARRALGDTAHALDIEDQERFEAALAEPTEAEIEHELARENFIQILDRPASKRFVVAAEKLDDSFRERVEAIVRDTPRKDPRYGRVAIAPGAGVDPDHSAEGVVFALAVDEPELKRLEARLKSTFANQLIESPLDDTVVARLAEADDVAIATGEPVPLVHHDPIAVASADAKPSSETHRPVLAEATDSTDHEASLVPDEPSELAAKGAPRAAGESRPRPAPGRRSLSKQKQAKERRSIAADSQRDASKGVVLDRKAELDHRMADTTVAAKPAASPPVEFSDLVQPAPEPGVQGPALNSVRIDKPAGIVDRRTQAAKPSTTIVIIEIVAASPKKTR